MTAPENRDPLPFGVSATTGKPLPGLSDQVADALLMEEEGPSPIILAYRKKRDEAAFAVVQDVPDTNDLGRAGWGLLYAGDVAPEIKKALQPLLELRQKEAGELFAIFDGDRAYRPGDTAYDWLGRRGVSLDTVDPRMGVPYYLLLVGSPEAIPFEFQYLLDMPWAVGRLWFDADPALDDAAALTAVAEQFHRYACSVVEYEAAARIEQTRQLALFGPVHDLDGSTQALVRNVLRPWIEGAGKVPPLGHDQKFQVQPFVAQAAMKETFRNILRGDIPGGPPAFLFAGGHGMKFDLGDPLQSARQGALVCNDWDGYDAFSPDHYFCASEIPADAHLHGLMAFLFACYGAGWPTHDTYHRPEAKPQQLSEKPMLARLPQSLLAYPSGGALAVVSHVDRTWNWSFQTPALQSQPQALRDVIAGILCGHRLGRATDTFNQRWGQLTIPLLQQKSTFYNTGTIDRGQLKNAFVARDDARNFIVFGDPAVRLRVDLLGKPKDQPAPPPPG